MFQGRAPYSVPCKSFPFLFSVLKRKRAITTERNLENKGKKKGEGKVYINPNSPLLLLQHLEGVALENLPFGEDLIYRYATLLLSCYNSSFCPFHIHPGCRAFRHVVEFSLAIMFKAHIPSSGWEDIKQSAVSLMFRLPSSTSSISPFEQLFSRPPDYRFLRTLGCLSFPCIRPHRQAAISLIAMWFFLKILLPFSHLLLCHLTVPLLTQLSLLKIRQTRYVTRQV